MDATPRSFGEGRYSLVDQLGEGGMATVWRAYDHRLGVWRAIKLLAKEYGKKRKLRARFDSEARTLAVLEHPNVVRVYDVGVEDDQPYIVMELAEGGTPMDWLEAHGPMPPRLAVQVVRQLCAGITAAHDRDIVHRDIKPHNVLVTRRGTCKVTDFGIARLADPDTGGKDLTRTGSVMGTLGFMAPEQRYDAKAVDVRSDVYAIGATLFTLLTNRTNMELFAADQDETMLDGVPPALVPILLKATRYKREERYEDVAAMEADLAVAQERLLSDPPDTPSLVMPIAASPPIPEAPARESTISLEQDYKAAKLTPRPAQPRSLANLHQPPSAARQAPQLRPDVPIGAAAQSRRTAPTDGPEPDYVVAAQPVAAPSGPSRAEMMKAADEAAASYVVTPAPQAAPQSYTIDLDPEERKPERDGDEDDDEDDEEGDGKKVDTAGGELADMVKFVWQIVWGILEGMAYPLRFVAGPLALMAIVGTIVVSLGTNMVGSAASTAESAQEAYIASFEGDHAELVSILIAAGANDQLLNQYVQEYDRAETPEQRVKAAHKLHEAIAYESMKPAVADAITRNGKRGTVDVTLRRLEAARQLQEATRSAWEEAASSTRGKWAIAAGAADAPGE